MLEIKVFFLCVSFLSVALSWSLASLFEQLKRGSESDEVSGKRRGTAVCSLGTTPFISVFHGLKYGNNLM